MELTSKAATVLLSSTSRESESESSSLTESTSKLLLSSKGSKFIYIKNKSRIFSFHNNYISSTSAIILITLSILFTIIDNSQLYANASRIHSPCVSYEKDKSIIEPFIEIYEPKGIRISMPMLNANMKEFEFHANINELISLDEPGTINEKAKFSEYWGQWTIFLKDSIVNVDDRIYYWYQIKINDTTERYEKLFPFFVKHKIPVLPNYEFYKLQETTTIHPLIYSYEFIPTTATPVSKPSCATACNSGKVIALENEIEYLRKEIREVQNEISPILGEINMLKDLIKQHFDESHSDRSLLLTSEKPIPYHNAIEEVRFIVAEKLRLPEYEKKIVQAKYNSCGILFEMVSSYDKDFLLLQAKNNLRNYHIKIIEPINEKNCLNSNKNTIIEEYEETN